MLKFGLMQDFRNRARDLGADSGQARVFYAANERIPRTEDSLAKGDDFELLVPI
jgi:hypothetical protein